MVYVTQSLQPATHGLEIEIQPMMGIIYVGQLRNKEPIYLSNLAAKTASSGLHA